MIFERKYHDIAAPTMIKKQVSYFFDVYGPFPVKRDKGSCTLIQRNFWKEVKEWDDGVLPAIGCYSSASLLVRK
jgi:hypothetical protein